jgi:hypothetical protein
MEALVFVSPSLIYTSCHYTTILNSSISGKAIGRTPVAIQLCYLVWTLTAASSLWTFIKMKIGIVFLVVPYSGLWNSGLVWKTTTRLPQVMMILPPARRHENRPVNPQNLTTNSIDLYPSTYNPAFLSSLPLCTDPITLALFIYIPSTPILLIAMVYF